MSKFCISCGNELDNNGFYCGNCGKSVSNFDGKNNLNNKSSIIGFVLSFISILLFFIFIFTPETESGIDAIFWLLSAMVSICSLVFSFIGLSKSKKSNGSGKAFSIAGVIINISLLFFFIVLFGMAFIIVIIEEIYGTGIL